MSTKIKGKKLFGMSLLLTISLVFVLGIIGLKKINSTLAQTNSVDAIAIRILENPNHYSALEWYKSKGFSGSPQSVIVDGYEAVRDGRTVYVNAANVINGVVANTLYTNIYLISYNQEAEKSTVDIFSRILANWKFNYNQPNTGHCRNKATTACLEDDDCGLGNFCDSQKARIIRDVRRLADLSLAKEIIEKYHSKKGYYPKLDAGSYLPHRTYSVWPSWREELGKELGGNLPVDPVNKIGDCPGFNEDTCWNETTLRFATTPPDLPQNSLVYSYNTFPGGTVY
ncbi:MAG: dickkopf-related protein, partial [Candidatus Falkowbacteria bacterium]|nr:dickkopf-related protein [Candidatus Falkowbacteria bacterium]